MLLLHTQFPAIKNNSNCQGIIVWEKIRIDRYAKIESSRCIFSYQSVTQRPEKGHYNSLVVEEENNETHHQVKGSLELDAPKC